MILQRQNHGEIAQAEDGVDDYHDVKLSTALLDGRRRSRQIVCVLLDLVDALRVVVAKTVFSSPPITQSTFKRVRW